MVALPLLEGISGTPGLAFCDCSQQTTVSATNVPRLDLLKVAWCAAPLAFCAASCDISHMCAGNGDDLHVCTNAVERALKTVAGVRSAAVSLTLGEARVVYEPLLTTPVGFPPAHAGITTTNGCLACKRKYDGLLRL